MFTSFAGLNLTDYSQRRHHYGIITKRWDCNRKWNNRPEHQMRVKDLDRLDRIARADWIGMAWLLMKSCQANSIINAKPSGTVHYYIIINASGVYLCRSNPKFRKWRRSWGFVWLAAFGSCFQESEEFQEEINGLFWREGLDSFPEAGVGSFSIEANGSLRHEGLDAFPEAGGE